VLYHSATTPVLSAPVFEWAMNYNLTKDEKVQPDMVFPLGDMIHNIFFFFFFCGTVIRTPFFALAKQALCHLNHISSPFFCGYFGDGNS
jgi:hypothetical protein